MSSILKRLGGIARSYVSKDGHSATEPKASAPTGSEEMDGGPTRNASSGPVSSRAEHHRGIPKQVLEDLATFGLGPPGSLKAARNARNREIKKYHSDKFLDDPERLETSKEIMQIFNAAYDRLAAYYQGKSPP